MIQKGDKIIGFLKDEAYFIRGILTKSIEEILKPLTFKLFKKSTETLSKGVENISIFKDLAYSKISYNKRSLINLKNVQGEPQAAKSLYCYEITVKH